MKNSKSTLAMLNDLAAGRRKYALVLFGVMVLTAFSEAMGITMVLPVLSNLLGEKQALTGVIAVVDQVAGFLSPDNKALVQICFLVAAFMSKNVLAVCLRGMNAHFSMSLRETWSARLLFIYLRDRYDKVLERKQGVMLHNAIMEPFQSAKSILVLLNLGVKLVLASAILLMLVLVNWKITLALLVAAGLIYTLTSNLIFSYSVRFGKQRLEVSQDVNTVAAESLGAIKEVKVCGREPHYKKEIQKHLALFTKIQTKFSIFNHLPENVIEIFAVTGVALVAAYIHLQAREQTAQVLSMTAFFVIAGQRLFNSLSYVMSQRMKFSAALPGIRLIHSIIYGKSSREDLKGGEQFKGLDKDIVLKDLGFSYGGDKPVFERFNMTIPANRMTALVGPSGSGKSTIADLLLGLLSPQKGAVMVNGKNLEEYSLGSWRKKTGYVGQDPVIFNTTIRANILAGNPDADQVQVEEAAKAASIHEFIVNLPRGYDTVVGDKGAKLSGGQRQRIVIARALIRNPDILIFDEATSALDTETEAAVTSAIDGLAGRKTILVIAHRLSTIKNADVVIDLGENQ